jgi:hypothetical protein
MYSLGSQALAKRRKTTAERKEEAEQKAAERAADPNEPWTLEVRLGGCSGVQLGVCICQWGLRHRRNLRSATSALCRMQRLQNSARQTVVMLGACVKKKGSGAACAQR